MGKTWAPSSIDVISRMEKSVKLLNLIISDGFLKHEALVTAAANRHPTHPCFGSACYKSRDAQAVCPFFIQDLPCLSWKVAVPDPRFKA